MKQQYKKSLEKDLISSNLSVTENFTARFAQEIENTLNNPYHHHSHQELWSHSEGPHSSNIKHKTF